jgi:hypothetical protein
MNEFRRVPVRAIRPARHPTMPRGDFMNRSDIPSLLAAGLLFLGLTACGASATAAVTPSAGALQTDYQNALPVESQLLLGTLKLEGTDNAVTPAQAGELLPMWQMMKLLNSSDTSAPQEKAGLTAQIEETMTAVQLKAIAEMKLTQSDLFAYMQQAGLSQAPQRTGTQSASGSAGGGFVPGVDGGGPPAGFEPGGGGFSGGSGRTGGNGGTSGQGLSSGQIATLRAQRSSSGNTGAGTSALLNALITLLEKKQNG